MSTSLSKVEEVYLEIPDKVKLTKRENRIIVEGPLGKVEKDFSKIRAYIEVKEGKVIIRSMGKKRKDKAIVGTSLSLIKNMIKGVTKGFTYKLKIVFAHFPISIKVKGDEVQIINFIGERAPRIAKIVGDTKIKVQGDDVLVYGVDLEAVSQTAANIEQATKIKRKDQRVFLDGIFIYEKSEGLPE
ncbi:50S ribosomal protein L6 [archaeon HR06]|nr:50S ribosomal protein L6 [archaeon HR06]